MKYAILCAWIGLGVMIIGACQSPDKKSVHAATRLEAIEDSLALAAARDAQEKIGIAVPVHLETSPVSSLAGDDAADDPAIWRHPKDPSKSVIYGSNKKGGIVSYDLGGQQLHFYELGNVNNIDVFKGFSCGASMDLLGGTNRTKQGLDIFRIDELGGLHLLHTQLADRDEVDDIYGFCFARDDQGRAYAFTNAKNGHLQQYELICEEDRLQTTLVREMNFDGQIEGMVSSLRTGKVYVGEEDRGIWMIDIDAKSQDRAFIKNSGEENAAIRYDVEGLTMLTDPDRDWLIASSQGNFSYAVFDIRDDHRYLGSFKLVARDSVDGVEETDGLEVMVDSFGSAFPGGLLVVQDGFNHAGDRLENQNFKYVRVEDLLDAMVK